MEDSQQIITPALKTLSFNHQSNRYDLAEKNYIYSMDLEHLTALKRFLKANPKVSLEDWYKKLADNIKHQVSVSVTDRFNNGFDASTEFE